MYKLRQQTKGLEGVGGKIRILQGSSNEGKRLSNDESSDDARKLGVI